MSFRALRRRLKNKLLSYSELEKLVREITCNDNSEPSTTAISNLIRLSNEDYFIPLYFAILKRLTDKKCSKHVLKSIHLLKKLFASGSEDFCQLLP